MNPSPLDISLIAKELNTQIIGSKIHYYPETESTNTIVEELPRNGAPEGTLVVTDYQRAGRGRENRKWVSPSNHNLLFSFLLRPPDSLQGVPQITSIAAVAVCEGIRRETGLQVCIKWPNDIRMGTKKLAGILTETTTKKNQVEYVIVGIGININTPQESFPAEVRGTATSLAIELKRNVSRERVLLSVLKSIDVWYIETVQNGIEKVVAHWKDLSDMTGKLVRVNQQSRITEGYVTNIDTDGGLLLRSKSGITDKIVSGEIEILS